MRRLRMVLVALVALVVLGAVLYTPARAAAVTRIMVVGDSITQGSAGDVTWRYRLSKHLQATPGVVDLVGDRTWLYDNITGQQGSTAYANSNFDQDHHAIWGRMLVDEVQTIGAAVTAANPDVMLVLLGTNDLTFGWSPQATANRTSSTAA